MERRTLGTNGLEVSAIGLGCMGLTGAWGAAPDRSDLEALIAAAIDQGVTFFDTAQVYGPLTNEALMGELLAPYRGRVVVALIALMIAAGCVLALGQGLRHVIDAGFGSRDPQLLNAALAAVVAVSARGPGPGWLGAGIGSAVGLGWAEVVNLLGGDASGPIARSTFAASRSAVERISSR